MKAEIIFPETGQRAEIIQTPITIVTSKEKTWTMDILPGVGPQGPRGRKGETGNGIESAVLNADYTLTLIFTDGESYTTSPIRGLTGNGIESAVLNADYTLTLIFTDGNSYTTPSIRGAKGDKGDPGYTPVRGADYWTEEDRQTVTQAAIEAVLEAYPAAEGVGF